MEVIDFGFDAKTYIYIFFFFRKSTKLKKTTSESRSCSRIILKWFSENGIWLRIPGSSGLGENLVECPFAKRSGFLRFANWQ